MNKTTFVTAFYNLGEDHFQVRSFEKNVSHFKTLASSGIPIVLYISDDFSSECLKLLFSELNVFENVKIVNYKRFCDLEVSKLFGNKDSEVSLPSNRNINKDTKNYMILMNSKIEFIKAAMDYNPFHTDQFAWIDFGIMYIIKDIPKVLCHLKTIVTSELTQDLLFPGCWNLQTSKANMSMIFDRIHWRFCGGFFLGKKEALEDFYNKSMDCIKQCIQVKNRFAWEVNIWALLEIIYNWKPNVYYADHNDSMLLPELK